MTDAAQDVDEAGELLRELATLERDIAGQPARYRRRIELVRRGQELGLTLRQMADAAGVKEGTLGQRLHKAGRRPA